MQKTDTPAKGAMTEAFENVKATPPERDPYMEWQKARQEELLGGPIAPVARTIGVGFADGTFRLHQRKKLEARLDAANAAMVYIPSPNAEDLALDRQAERSRRARLALIYRLLRERVIVSDIASASDSEVEEVLQVSRKYRIPV